MGTRRPRVGIACPAGQGRGAISRPGTRSDPATGAEAHRYDTGVEFGLVNGVIAIENGGHTGMLAGKVLLKTDQ